MREEIASGDAFLLLAALCLLAGIEMLRRVLHSVPMRDGSTWLDQHARHRMANRCIRARWIGARVAFCDRAGGGFGSIFRAAIQFFPHRIASELGSSGWDLDREPARANDRAY